MTVLAAVGVTAFIVGFALFVGAVAGAVVSDRVEPVADVVAKVGLALIVGAVVVGIALIIQWVWSGVTW